jgi:hypothetical protein
MMARSEQSKSPGRFSMALTFQRSLELAGVFSKVQPRLERLHLVEKPKPKRHLRRKVILVASTIAVGALVAGVVRRRRSCWKDGAAGNEVDRQTTSPEQNRLDAEPDAEDKVTDAEFEAQKEEILQGI